MPTPQVGLTRSDSQESWPAHTTPPPGSPNILVILLDDVGFAQLGCFGSSIRTPHIDRLAARGLRFPNFHTTATCSPTRAALLTGRNPHAVGFGAVTERMAGFPGYSMQLPSTAVTVAELLRRSGYSTRAVGKWHLTPSYETGPQGPFERWPLGCGFQRFYGFLAGFADQYTPELVRDNTLLPPPDLPDPNYHLSSDLVDESIEQIAQLQALAPHLPFFHYLAFGAAHAPHQVDRPWIEEYEGAFDHGWDVERDRVLARQIELGVIPEGTQLGQSNPGVTPWADLDEDHRRAFSRMMEVYAAFVAHTDAQIGRLLDHLERTGTLDDTVIVLLSDNGASGEGGPHGLVDALVADDGVDDRVLDLLDDLGGPNLDNHYPWGWAQAGNTPFRWYKQFTHAGGITNGLLLSWPSGGVPQGEIRHQYHHVIDIAPTLMDIAGVAVPSSVDGVDQQPVDGVSMRYAFSDAAATTHRPEQHYEMWGNRGYWRDGWMAISQLHPLPERSTPRAPALPPLSELEWSLYDHRTDPTERRDVARQHPEVVADLERRWWAAAARNQVLPVDDRPRDRRWTAHVPWPPGADPRGAEFTGPGGPYERGAAPRIVGGSFRLTADVTADPQAEGVLYAYGGRFGGYAWYLKDGQVTFEVTLSARHSETVRAPIDLTAGPHELAVRVRLTSGGKGEVTHLLDGQALATGTVSALVDRLPVHAGRSWVGRAGDTTASGSYLPPFAFTHHIHRLGVVTEKADGTIDEQGLRAAELREQ